MHPMHYGYGNQVPVVRKKSLLQSVYDLLRRLVDDHNWRQESDKLRAHGVINQADPNYTAPEPGYQTQLTPEQLTIVQLQQQLAALQAQQGGYVQAPLNAEQQMRQYAYPTPQQAQQAPQQVNVADFAANYQPQPQPSPNPPPGYPQNGGMRQYAYPAPQQPSTQYNPVTPFQ